MPTTKIMDCENCGCIYIILTEEMDKLFSVCSQCNWLNKVKKWYSFSNN